MVGFLCSTKEDYEAFKCLATDSVAQGPNPLFTFTKEPMKFNENVDVLSDFDEEFLL